MLLIAHLVFLSLLIMGFGKEIFGEFELRLARSRNDVEAVTRTLPLSKKLIIVGTAGVVLSGAVMAFQKHGWSFFGSWIAVSIIATFGVAAIGGTITGKRFEHIRSLSLKTDGEVITPELAAAIKDPGMHYALWASVGIFVAIVVLMTAKPGTVGSIVCLFAGVAGGLVLGLLVGAVLNRQVAKQATKLEQTQPTG